MLLEFTKMNGAGNDFVLADNRAGDYRLRREDVVRLCHRQRGIGADGLMLVVPCVSGRADWAWEFYNSDGSVADMCGNGARCFARYVQRLTGAAGPITFETAAGVIRAELDGARVTVNLTLPRDLQLRQRLVLKGAAAEVHSVNTGVPHVVMLVSDTDRVAVATLGSEIRHHAHFAPGGTNVNFVQVRSPGSIRVRTYERGVEGETLACGTGVTAAALVCARLSGFASPVLVAVQGGDTLKVGFREEGGEFRDVRLTGPAEFVFDGRIGV